MAWWIWGLFSLSALALPTGPAPQPVTAPYFPTPVHAFIWRNWSLVPTARLAETIGAPPEQIIQMGRRMGLSEPPAISDDQWRRSYITIIRRNWHLLPYDQLLKLLGWTPEKLDFTLREDDFLWVKLGLLKPQCAPLVYAEPDTATAAREAAIAQLVRADFPDLDQPPADPLFGFVKALSAPTSSTEKSASPAPQSSFSPRFCYSYFALYGDPLLEPEADPFPDGYLARLAASGVDGVWLQGVLYKLAPFPWDPAQSEHAEERLARLRELVARARRHGIGIYLYLNEPRAMPLAFFEKHPELKGVVEGDHAALCASAPAVHDYLRDSVATVCRAVPDLAGIFTITASENLTNCWSHMHGETCPRCAALGPEATIAGVNTAIVEGIAASGSKTTRLIAWDWGWPDAWAQGIIDRLPPQASLMSVSEWDLPIERGGVASVVGEYSISAVGPGPRATRHWAAARTRGLHAIAKIQASNSWELSAVPYIPAVENVAQHAANLRAAGVDGLMLGWTLGGYPSPNLEVVAALGRSPELTPETAMEEVARARFGAQSAADVLRAWRLCSAAFREFPYQGSVLYQAPLQMGPANPLWATPTGYKSSMVGLPYDDLESWRGAFPAEVFAGQLTKVADGFASAALVLRRAKKESRHGEEGQALAHEADVTEACAIHFRSAANQARFVMARDALAKIPAEVTGEQQEQARAALSVLERLLRDELTLARRLYAIQRRDSRIGFEASNQYYYVPLDLVEKAIDIHNLLERWLPDERARRGL